MMDNVALDLDELKHFMLNFRKGIHDAKIENAIAESQPKSPYIPGAANLEYNKYGWNDMGLYNLEINLDYFTPNYELSRTNEEYDLDIVNYDDSGRTGCWFGTNHQLMRLGRNCILL